MVLSLRLCDARVTVTWSGGLAGDTVGPHVGDEPGGQLFAHVRDEPGRQLFAEHRVPVDVRHVVQVSQLSQAGDPLLNVYEQELGGEEEGEEEEEEERRRGR